MSESAARRAAPAGLKELWAFDVHCGVRALRSTITPLLQVTAFLLMSCRVLDDVVRPSLIITFVVYAASADLASRLYFARRSASGAMSQRTWRVIVVALASMLGLGIGVDAFLVLRQEDDVLIYIVWTLLIMSIGAAAALFASLRVFYLAAVTTILPLIAGWIATGHSLALVMVPLTGALTLGYCTLARARARNQARLAQLSVGNEELSRMLRQQVEELGSAARATSDLLLSASHDLRQPVHALGILTELLSNASEDEVRARLPQVRANVQHLEGMLEQLLDHNRLEAGLYRTAMSPVALHELIESTMVAFKDTAARKGLELTAMTRPTWVMTDLNLMRRVLINLVTNAIRYTSQGSVQIKSLIHCGTVVLSISDTGTGIPQERLADVTQRFVRLNLPGGQEQDSGLGLGLNIVQRAADLLGHSLNIQSEVGRGTTVALSLGPALDPVDAPQSGLAPLEMDSDLVVVIENHRSIREGLMSLFRDWGCNSIGAQGLSDAMRLLAKRDDRPAFLLSDMHLDEEADGIQVIQAIRAQYPEGHRIPALLVTGDLDPALERRAAASGIVVKHKPLNPARLRRRAAEMMSQPPEGI